MNEKFHFKTLLFFKNILPYLLFYMDIIFFYLKHEQFNLFIIVTMIMAVCLPLLGLYMCLQGHI